MNLSKVGYGTEILTTCHSVIMKYGTKNYLNTEFYQ